MDEFVVGQVEILKLVWCFFFVGRLVELLLDGAESERKEVEVGGLVTDFRDFND